MYGSLTDTYIGKRFHVEISIDPEKKQVYFLQHLQIDASVNKLRRSDVPILLRENAAMFPLGRQRALQRGRVEICGLCAFKVKEYPSYTGRNPKSGEPVTVKGKKLPFFKPGTDLKKRVDR
jgi:hypothetical protein